LKPFLQRDCVVTGLVPCRKEQGDRSFGHTLAQLADGLLGCRLRQFGIIGGLELVPPRRVAMEEPAQCVARRDVLEPQPDLRALSRHAARPKAINQDTDAVLVVRRIVDPFDPQQMPSHCSLYLSRDCRWSNVAGSGSPLKYFCSAAMKT